MEFASLLDQGDRELLSLSLEDLRARVQASASANGDGLWSAALLPHVCGRSRDELVVLHWVTERHYAGKLRASALTPLLQHYLTIGYARVISLRMGYEENMGCSADDVAFTLLVASTFLQPRERVRILEVGCGAGQLMAVLVKHGYMSVYGIDMAPAAVRIARRRLAQWGMSGRVSCATPEDLLVAGLLDSFDLIICCDVIEHIPPSQVAGFLSTLCALMRPGGRMVMGTPSALTGPHDITRSFMPLGSPPLGFHLHEYALGELTTRLREAGLSSFQTVNSPPASKLRGGGLSTHSHHRKVRLEPWLMRLDWERRSRILDRLYFKSLVCEKPLDSEAAIR